MAGTPYVERRRVIKTLFRPQIRENRQMATSSKDELHKTAEADDLHIAPFRENGVTYGTPHVDLVRRGRRHSLRARLQRAELSLVSSCGAAKGRPVPAAASELESPRQLQRLATASLRPDGT